MTKRVILTLLKGSYDRGFPVILRIGEPTGLTPWSSQIIGHLPPAPGMEKALSNWQSAYRQVIMPSARIKPKPVQITNFSCYQFGDELAICLNRWLNSTHPDWQKIRDELQRSLYQTEEVEVIIETEVPQLRQIPWHLWDLFDRYYTRAEVALSTPNYRSLSQNSKYQDCPVKILAILGDDTNINIQEDEKIIAQLRDSQSKFLVRPTREELFSTLYNFSCNILFFAGHSFTKENNGGGEFYINEEESVSLSEFKTALRKAIENGLKLAIFNSCDGLGLAEDLAEVQIPQTIFMRELVPDQMAQEFLKHFLQSFANGQSLYLSVREARERLEAFSDRYPFASWLPAIYQNPAEETLTWEKLKNHSDRNSNITPVPPQPKPSKLKKRGNVSQALLTSVVVTALVMGARSQEFLQAWELQAYDFLIGLQYQSQPDERFTIITINEEDIQYQAENYSDLRDSLSNQALTEIVDKLKPYHPRVIALDIVRDFELPQGLLTALQNQPFIWMCQIPDLESQLPSFKSPPNLTQAELGFINFPLDSDDVIRRQFLGMRRDEDCPTARSLGLKVALQYLATEPNPVHPNFDNIPVKIGSLVFPKLEHYSGGYQMNPAKARGYQILLDYRSSFPNQIALRALLNGSVDAELTELVNNRIVLIGRFEDRKDAHYIPSFSRQRRPKIPGVLIHAHLASQILNAVLEQRPLIRWWPEAGETVWIWVWGLVGGGIVVLRRSRLEQVLAIALGLAALCLACALFFLNGYWIPLIPPVLTLVLTAGTPIFYLNRKY
ncbi:MAG: CHASE2 domain-containing protein [Desertifilum sp.]|nr:CHASE2 domain-containing protein [Desertifilum sp.]